MVWLLMFLTFVAATASVVAGYFVFADFLRRDENVASQRMQAFRKDGQPDPEAPVLYKQDASAFDLGEFTLPPVQGGPPPLAAWLRRDWLKPLRTMLVRSALPFTLNQVFAVSAGLAVVLGVSGWVLQGPFLGVPSLLCGLIAPLAWVRAKYQARQDRFLNQLPSAFELMARVLRSGQSVPAAFQAVADSFEEPLGSAFARCREQQNLGLAPETALEELAEQTGLLDVRIFVMALLVQRQAGGNLSEVLERLAVLARERGRIRKQVRVLTAEGRLQAAILLVLPFFLFLALRFVNREYTDALFDHVGLLIGMGVTMLVGALWIRRIVNFEV